METKTCSVDGCERPHQSLGYCKGHASRVRKYGHPGSPDFRIRKIEHPEIEPDVTLRCRADGCDRRFWAKGYCPTHYRRWSRYGDPTAKLRQKYLPKKCVEDGCNEPPAARDRCNSHYQKWMRAQGLASTASNRPHNRKYILAQYGMTIGDYEAMAASQNDRCAICFSPDPGGNGRKYRTWHVDHDHSTGRVRGLLCRNCNIAIGLLRDDPEMLRAALAYLTK